MHSSIIPALSPHVRIQSDRLTGKPILLGPEVALELTDSGAEILALCDGARTLADIAAKLATEYDADPADILADAADFLEKLADKGYIHWQESPQ